MFLVILKIAFLALAPTIKGMNHDDAVKRAHELLEESNLHANDVALWKKRLRLMESEAIALFVGVIERDAHLLERVTENMKLKLATTDNSGTEKIVRAEREELLGYLEN